MRTYSCTCGNKLFFDNSICMCCKRDVGWCSSCRVITDVSANDNGTFTCAQCNASLVKCDNYSSHNVCNRFVVSKKDEQVQGTPPPPVLCDCCRFNKVIPDLHVKGNHEKWYRLEAAKRRVMYDLDQLNFPYGNQQDGIEPALTFEFKGDIIPDQKYKNMSGGQKVYTGHDTGTITINIQEADDIERETLRVTMHEAHRSLLGHFRHEFGHYIWDVLVKGKNEADFIALFGDHNNPDYGQALTTYYQKGPRPDWLLNYVSAYATMHPWEDFAETFTVYLDMASSLDTAAHGKLIQPVDPNDLDAMVDAYKKLGIALNEMNRAIGLLDFLPEMFAKPIREKLRFIHKLAAGANRQAPAAVATGAAA